MDLEDLDYDLHRMENEIRNLKRCGNNAEKTYWTISRLENLIESARREARLHDCFQDHDCEECHNCDDYCSHKEDYYDEDYEENIRINRDAIEVHDAIEENYPWQRKHLEKLLGHETRCQRAGCTGLLWVEYIENRRYLVKCTEDCRIIWVEANSFQGAIDQANGVAHELRA